MTKIIIYAFLILSFACKNNSKVNEQKKIQAQPPLLADNVSYIIFGQYSNDRNSRWKQFYRISGDSLFEHFKGGEYFNYQTNSWVIDEKQNVYNLLLSDSLLRKILPLLKDIPKTMLSYSDSLLGDKKSIEQDGMYIEIGNGKQNRHWKVNEFDNKLAVPIKIIDDNLRSAIEILDPDNDE